ncbi:MAG: hypothetical protein V7744_11860 [Pseudomonadales bacterium]
MSQIFSPLLKPIFTVPLLLVILSLSATYYANAESEQKNVLAVLDKYMDAVNRIDIEGITDTYHFPHFRVARGGIVIWNTPQEAMPILGMPRDQQLSAMREALGEEWQRTEWAHKTVIASSETKVHVDTEFIRYSISDKELERVNSLYILTKENGIWRIKGRSSFSPR